MSVNATVNGTVATVPANGQPTTLAEIVDHEALAYRAWRTPEGDLLARQLERVAKLIRWTGGATPDEHEARLEIWDRQLADDHHQRGFTDGYDAARRELAQRRSRDPVDAWRGFRLVTGGRGRATLGQISETAHGPP